MKFSVVQLVRCTRWAMTQSRESKVLHSPICPNSGSSGHGTSTATTAVTPHASDISCLMSTVTSPDDYCRTVLAKRLHALAQRNAWGAELWTSE